MGLRLPIIIALISSLLIIAPYIYYQMDRREFNRRTTAEEAARDNNFQNKIAIVTGSSSGIGIPTAKVLYENGATVIMAVRNTTKGKRIRKEILSSVANKNTDSNNLIVMELDLASLKSVESFSFTFIERYKQLNLLINNAGIMGNDDFGLTVDGIEQQFGINNIGHFYLTQKLMDLLIGSATKHGISRVINVASFAYFGAPSNIKDYLLNEDKINDAAFYSPMQRYGLTKACNIIFSSELNRRYASKGVYSVSLHPGGIKTGLQKYNFWLGFWKYAPNIWTKTLSQGASTSIRVAAMSDDEFIKNGGKYFEDCNVASLHRADIIDNDKQSEELARLYWELSERMIKSRT